MTMNAAFNITNVATVAIRCQKTIPFNFCLCGFLLKPHMLKAYEVDSVLLVLLLNKWLLYAFFLKYLFLYNAI